MLRGRLPAFAGEFQEAVLVDGMFQFIWNQQFAKYLQSLQMSQNMLGLGGTGRLDVYKRQGQWSEVLCGYCHFILS